MNTSEMKYRVHAKAGTSAKMLGACSTLITSCSAERWQERVPGNETGWHLKGWGWEQIGGGFYSAAAVHPEFPGYVFRISTRPSDGTRAYHRMILQGDFNLNGVRMPCVPDVQCTVSGNGLWITVMERFVGDMHDTEVGGLSVDVQATIWQVVGEVPYRYDSDRWVGSDVLDEHSGDAVWEEMLNRMLEVGMPVNDIHKGNIMFRADGTAVLTDPCSGRRETGSAVMSSARKSRGK